MDKKMIFKFLLQICLIILIAGCATKEETEDSGGVDPSDPPVNDNMENINISDPTPEEEPEEEQYENTPDLKGGSERDEREPNPVDNFELQKAFPDTVVLRGSMNQKKMALTFDDGPDELITPAVLDALNRHGVRATFFLIGERAEAHPDVVQRIIDEGHVIANHSWNHPKFTEISLDEVEEQIKRTESALLDITGHAVRMFRPPYGFQNEDIVRTLGDMNYSDIIWSQDSLDWKDLDAEEVADNILSDITYGAIILQHSAGGGGGEGLMRTVEALDKVIPELKEDDIQFLTVDELLNIEAYR